jgi:hypothetical protein
MLSVNWCVRHYVPIKVVSAQFLPLCLSMSTSTELGKEGQKYRVHVSTWNYVLESQVQKYRSTEHRQACPALLLIKSQ